MHVPLGHIHKYPFIDALRGIAVIMVVASHVGFCTGCASTSVVESIQIQLSRGVLLFFMVSAFTLFLSMDTRMRIEEHSLSHFFIRRFFRIAPMFYFAALYYVFLDPLWYGNIIDVNFTKFISSLTFVAGVHPYLFDTVVPIGWTVPVEMSFYVLVPFLFKKIKTMQRALWVVVIGAVIAQVLRLLLLKFPLIPDHVLWFEWLYKFLPTQLPIFFLGIVLYFLFKESKQEKSTQISPSFLVCIAGIFLFFIAFGNIVSMDFLFSVGLFIFCYALSKYPFSFFVNRFTKFVGRISFSVYLVHTAVIHLMFKYNFLDELIRRPIANYITKILIALFVSILISTITYHAIERPGQKLGKKLIIWFEKKRAGVMLPEGAKAEQTG